MTFEPRPRALIAAHLRGQAGQRHRGEHADELVGADRVRRGGRRGVAAGARRSTGQARSHAGDAAVLQHRQARAASPSGVAAQGPAAQLLVAFDVGAVAAARSPAAHRRPLLGATGPGPAPAPPNEDAPGSRTARRSRRPDRPTAATGRRSQRLAGEGDHLVGELVRPPRARAGPAPAPASPPRVDRRGGLIERRAGEPERRRRAAHRLPVDPHPAHHLVLDLHQVAGVEELRASRTPRRAPPPAAGSGCARPAAPPPSDPVRRLCHRPSSNHNDVS